VRRDGSGLTWIPDSSENSNPTWLAGSRLAFLTEFSGRQAQALAVTNADGTGRRTLARTSDIEAYRLLSPSASPNGMTIAFSAYGPNYLRWSLFLVNVDRGSPPRYVADGQDAAWAPSGRRLVFYDSNALWTARLDGSRLRRLWRPNAYFPGLPSWSPDGTRIAFVATHTTSCKVVVMNLRRGSFAVVARSGVFSPSCLRRPVWSTNSRRLYYVALPGS
jgi:Tol biopolymer transport system component